MYCSSCGVALAERLSYCNYCGAKQNSVTDEGDVRAADGVKPDFLVFAMAATFIFGLAAIALLMVVTRGVIGSHEPIILAITLLSFFILLLLEGIYIRLLFRSKRRRRDKEDSRSNIGSTKELGNAQPQGLPSMPSVTEHTTRAFDPVYTERTTNK